MSQEGVPRKASERGPSQVGSRTPIRFGPAVEQVFRQDLAGYSPLFSEVTSEYLLYGYHRQARDDQHVFVLVQGARFSGNLVSEVALSRRGEYPFYRLSDRPQLGVGGFRERVSLLVSGTDSSVRYGSQFELQRALRELVSGQTGPALRTLNERAGPVMYREQQTWEPLFKEWLHAEKVAPLSGDRRYPGLANEVEATGLLQEMLMGRKFDRFLGPLKFRYREPSFFNCHVYLLGRGLEFLDPPEGAVRPEVPQAPATDPNGPQRMITWADILGPPPPPETEVRKGPERPAPLGDAIAGITGRHPQGMAFDLSPDPQVRYHEYAFLKSLAALEAFYEEEVRR